MHIEWIFPKDLFTSYIHPCKTFKRVEIFSFFFYWVFFTFAFRTILICHNDDLSLFHPQFLLESRVTFRVLYIKEGCGIIFILSFHHHVHPTPPTLRTRYILKYSLTINLFPLQLGKCKLGFCINGNLFGRFWND